MKTIDEALQDKNMTVEDLKKTDTPTQDNETKVDNQDNTEPTEDIVTRVAKMDSKSTEKEPDTDTKFNVDDINKIADPEAKKYAEEAYKLSLIHI